MSRFDIAELACDNKQTQLALTKYLHSRRTRADAERLIYTLNEVYDECANDFERPLDPWEIEGLDGEKIALGVGA